MQRVLPVTQNRYLEAVRYFCAAIVIPMGNAISGSQAVNVTFLTALWSAGEEVSRPRMVLYELVCHYAWGRRHLPLSSALWFRQRQRRTSAGGTQPAT